MSEITDALTMIGLEVEHIDTRESLHSIKIAEVLTASPHPDADRLQVLSVSLGTGAPIQVVCGAPNARAGMKGAFASPGTYISGIDITLTKSKIRGVESHGMMCSGKELELSDDHDGILDLPADAPIGDSFAEYMNLSDPIIEIGITPNRSDALGVFGIARDLSAFGLGELKHRDLPDFKCKGKCPTKVDLTPSGSADFCPAFGLRLIKNVKNVESPAWLQSRLKAIGLRPISALVDITNYLTFDYGRPLHVFDADKVKGDLVIRPASSGEEFLALDGKTYTLSPSHFVIADDNGAESLAGVMGGESSGCSFDTTNVLLESALWDPLTVARTGRDLSITSDARYRFERGVDPQFMEEGLDRGTQMILDLCGGEPTESIIAGSVPTPDTIIDFPLSEIKRLTSIDVPATDAVSILERLGFSVESAGDILKVSVPGFRPDISLKADLVEEIMRIHGVNNIESLPLPRSDSVGSKILTTAQVRSRSVRRLLASRGMSESVCYSFIPRSHAQAFGGGDDSLGLLNPIASDLTHMRPSLLPSLLSAAKRNVDRGILDLSLFEVSHIYRGLEPSDQHRVASGIRRGKSRLEHNARHWSGESPSVDVFDSKEDALSVLDICGVNTEKIQIVENGDDWYHPGRSGKLMLGPKTTLGSFGEFHPLILELLDITGPLCGFEIFLDSIPDSRGKKGSFTVSNLQSVHRDFSFIVDIGVRSADIIRAAYSADKDLIVSVCVFDLFSGDMVGDGKKSIGIEVILQPRVSSLTDEEIDLTSSSIVSSVVSATGGILRG